jgi:hypothetical protein
MLCASGSANAPSEPESGVTRSSGFSRCGEEAASRTIVPPTASATGLYSSSGSITRNSVPATRWRSASSLVKYDFPDQAGAMTARL